MTKVKVKIKKEVKAEIKMMIKAEMKACAKVRRLKQGYQAKGQYKKSKTKLPIIYEMTNSISEYGGYVVSMT